MQLTSKQNAVVDHLRRCHVASMNQLMQSLDLSHMTVFRALKKYGYYTSFNHNARFYTLHDTLRFDRRGLWFYEQIGFSRHGNLKQTLLALIEQSDGGCTVAELQQTLATQVGVVVSRLRGEEQLGLFRRGRQAVYLARDPKQQSQQMAARRRQREQEAPALPATRRKGIPAGLKSLEVIHLLIQMVRMPQASDASLARTLQNAEVPITAEQVRHVRQFYGLGKKKRHAGRGRAGA